MVSRGGLMVSRYYFAYGSNLNIAQMLDRCPSAMPLKRETLAGWRLEFRGVATVRPVDKACVHGAIYRLTPDDEAALDQYEGFDPADPQHGLYRKEFMEFLDDRGEIAEAMFYAMNRGRLSLPHPWYLRSIEQGYRDWGLDSRLLNEAVWRAEAATLALPL